MCGIVGLISPAGRQTHPDVIRAMRDLVSHRGPNDRGFASVDSATGTISSGIDGMFAIVICDSRKRSAAIARDRFGIKPL